METQERIMVSVFGRSFTGTEWLDYASQSKRFVISPFAEEILRRSLYNEKHRLQKGREYILAFLVVKELTRSVPQELSTLKRVVKRRHGALAVNALCAEHALLLADMFSMSRFRQLGLDGLNGIVIPHATIPDTEGGEVTFCLRFFEHRSMIDAKLLYPFNDQGNKYALAYIVGVS